MPEPRESATDFAQQCLSGGGKTASDIGAVNRNS
jgi:hypothetical protein